MILGSFFGFFLRSAGNTHGNFGRLGERGAQGIYTGILVAWVSKKVGPLPFADVEQEEEKGLVFREVLSEGDN